MKNALSRAVGLGATGGGTTRLPQVLGRYVQAQGGARQAAQSAVAGTATGRNLARFLADATQVGLPGALERLDLLGLADQGAQAVLVALMEALAPDGAEREEALARDALCETMRDWYDLHAEEPEVGLTGEAAARELLEGYLTHYVFLRAEAEIGECIERKAMTAGDAERFCQEMRDVARGFIELELDTREMDTINWAGPEGMAFVNKQLERMYRMLEHQA